MIDFVSIDIETTGTDPNKHDILEVACVKFVQGVKTDVLHLMVHYPGHIRVWEDDTLLFHLRQNRIEYFLRNTAKVELVKHENVWHQMNCFFGGKVWVGGKNFAAFDLGFIRRLPGYTPGIIRSRSLDLGNLMIYPDDTGVPDTKECYKRLGVADEVAHTALEDAILVGKCIANALKTP